MDEGFMSTLLNHTAFIENDNLVRFCQGLYSVADDERCDVFTSFFQRLTDTKIRFSVHCTQGIIKNKNSFVLIDDGSRDGDTLLLSTGKGNALFSDDGVISVLEGQDIVVDGCGLGCIKDVIFLVGSLGDADVLLDGFRVKVRT